MPASVMDDLLPMKASTIKSVAIIGASVGGLVAAAELRACGLDVTLFEAGKHIAGMYGKVQTPFGEQELGMHVLYLSARQYEHLCSIFGDEAFQTWTGPSVDIGSHRNFGRNFFDTVYPDLRGHTELDTMRQDVLAGNSKVYKPTNALEAVVGRFGAKAGHEVYSSILQKLWKTDASLLSADAIHCFYDLRRIVLWDKPETDRLKLDPWFDAVVANPDQNKPHSGVFGGRMAARFKPLNDSLSEKIDTWIKRSGIRLELGKSATIHEKKIWIDNTPVNERFDACIVATPVATLIPSVRSSMDALELSIYYFRLEKGICNDFPAYYMLLHEGNLLSSRIVNYDAYNTDDDRTKHKVISVEVAHTIGMRPTIASIADEVRIVFPMATITDGYLFPNSLKTPIPSLKNTQLIDAATSDLNAQFDSGALYFTGMRTDKGVFFSHHTIGLAHESALDCARRLA